MPENEGAEPIYPSPATEAEAIRWHVRLHSGEVAPHEKQSFTRWLDDDTHQQSFAETERVWASLGGILGEDTRTEPLRPSVRLFTPFGLRAMAMAASLLVTIGCSYQYLHVWQHDYVAQGHARQTAMLADGTRIALDAGAAIDVAYVTGRRSIRLVRGRAYFDVRHDASRPFVIDVGDGEVSVLGTAFSVARSNNGNKVVVERGRVRVRAGRDSVDVLPDQSIGFGNGHDGPVTRIDAASELGWSRGKLYFKNQPISAIVAELDRYYPGVIVLADDKAAKHRISAAINLDDMDNWLAALGRSQGLAIRKLPGILLIS